MKKYLLFAILSLWFTTVFSAEKIVFFACGESSAACSGAYNGARNAAATIGEKYGRNVKVEYVSIGADATLLADALSKAYIDGAAGGLIFLSKNLDSEILKNKVSELSSKNFPICFAGAKIDGAKFLSAVFTDSKKALEIIDAQIKKYGGAQNIPLFCVGNNSSTGGVLNGSILEKFKSSHKILKDVNTEYYSIFAKENEIEIKRFDTYGLLILDASVLSDVSPIAFDVDRKFVIALDAAPYLIFYFKSGILDACVFEDYFGFGYCMGRDICENLFGNVSPKGAYLLPPLLFEKGQTAAFVDLWKQWMRH